MKNAKSNFGFCIYEICQILKRFTGTFRRAQTLKFGGVIRRDNKTGNLPTENAH